MQYEKRLDSLLQALKMEGAMSQKLQQTPEAGTMKKGGTAPSSPWF